MTDQDRKELERRIHSLLNGLLGATERDDLLGMILRDRGAREVFDEMLEWQVRARAALGPVDEKAVAARVQAVCRSASSGRRGPGPARRGVGRRRWGMRVLLSSAALVMVAVSAYVWGRSSGRAGLPARRSGGPAGAPVLAAAQIEQFRRIWQHVAEQDSGARPWMLLTPGGGEFGYVPVDEAADGRLGLLLVRCLLAGADGRDVRVIHLLVPSQKGLHVSLPEVMRLADDPVRCDIATGEQWATTGLTVGAASPGVGVRGQVRIGGELTEVGCFALHGRNLSVWVQVVPLAGTAG